MPTTLTKKQGKRASTGLIPKSPVPASPRTKSRSNVLMMPKQLLPATSKNGEGRGHVQGDPQVRIASPSQSKTPQATALLMPSDGVPADEIRSGGHLAADARRPDAAAPRSTPPTTLRLMPVSGMSAAPSSGNGDHRPRDAQRRFVPVSPDLISGIRELYRSRRFFQDSQYAAENHLRAFVRLCLGWNVNAAEKDRKAVNAKAATIADALFDLAKRLPVGDYASAAAMEDEAGAIEADDADRPAIRNAAKPAWSTWLVVSHCTAMLKEIDKRIAQLVERLPVWTWAEAVKGLSHVGIATYVGEAGDLSAYANPAKLWKRMGLAPKPCYDAVTKDGEKCNLKPKRRRSASWRIAESLLKQRNVYQAIYYAERDRQAALHPEFSKGTFNAKGRLEVYKHCDNRARRVAEKELVLDLWCVWNGRKVREKSPAITRYPGPDCDSLAPSALDERRK